MPNNWLKPTHSSTHSVELYDRTGAPVRGSVEHCERERIVPTAHGDMYEREEYRRVRLWRGRSLPDRRDI